MLTLTPAPPPPLPPDREESAVAVREERALGGLDDPQWRGRLEKKRQVPAEVDRVGKR